MDYSKIFCPLTKREAKEILTQLREILNIYGFATLADLHDLIGSRFVCYDNNFKGWRSLTKAKIRWSFRRGYRIILPPIEEIPAESYL